MVGQVFVADIDGSNVHALEGTYFGNSARWTGRPTTDSSRSSRPSPVSQSLTIAEADGSGATTLPLDRQINTARYLPDGRLAFIGSQEAGVALRRA